MKFNCLIPELRVFDLEKSKKFYTEILGFEIAYARNDFAMLVLNACFRQLSNYVATINPSFI